MVSVLFGQDSGNDKGKQEMCQAFQLMLQLFGLHLHIVEEAELQEVVDTIQVEDDIGILNCKYRNSIAQLLIETYWLITSTNPPTCITYIVYNLVTLDKGLVDFNFE